METKKMITTFRFVTNQILHRASSSLNRIATQIYESPQQKRVAPWFADNGDKTLRLNYELDENSIVFDLGGYEGQWASDIFAMYNCWIHIFEPVDEFAKEIERRFSKNHKVFVHQIGLAANTQDIKIGLSQDASSIYKPGKRLVNARLVSAIDFIRMNDINHIDLIKINIEGGEYDLLEHLIEAGFITKIKNIQVQFHDFVAEAQTRTSAIQALLTQTHYLTYQYPFVWENWCIKNN